MITSSGTRLADAIDRAGKATGGPSGSHHQLIRMQVEDGLMTVTGVNHGGYWLKTYVKVMFNREGFDCCIRPQRLSQILKTVGDEMVTMSVGGNGLTIKSGRNDWRLLDEEAANFPQYKAQDHTMIIRVSGAGLGSAIALASKFTAVDSTRFATGGVLIGLSDPDHAIDIVATDSRSLIRFNREATVIDSAAEKAVRHGIMPPQVCRLLGTMPELENVTIGFGQTIGFATSVVDGGWCLHTNTIDGRFPPWKTIVDPHSRATARGTVDSAMFGSCIRKASAALDDTEEGVTVEIKNGTIAFSGGVNGIGFAECEMVHDSAIEPLKVLFSGKRLATVMASCGKGAQIEWRQNNADTLGLFTGEKCTFALMPMDVKG